MRKAFVLTAYNRPEYLKQALESLAHCRGAEEWDFYFSIDPSEKLDEVLGLIEDWRPVINEYGIIRINKQRQGVLEHPYQIFDFLFNTQHYDYVLRSEDDLLLSHDALEFHAWAAEEFQGDSDVGIVTGFAADNRSHAECHRRIGLGSPLLIGTWRDRWNGVIRDTWDHDYSTGRHGEQGWDHNLHLRVFPEHGLHAIIPNNTKVEHIGKYGQHSVPEIFFSQGPLDPDVPPQTYREVIE